MNLSDLSPHELAEHIRDCFAEFKNRGADAQAFIDIALYEPSDKLKQYINKYIDWCNSNPGKNARLKAEYYQQGGKLMEQVAFLAFQCLSGVRDIDPFITVDSQAQLDLIVTGNLSFPWRDVCEAFGLINPTTKIIVEAKNKNEILSAATFSRLCYIIESHFKDQCNLGVFFSRNGATGFNRQRCIIAAKATQVLFYVRTQTYVIVLDHLDVLRLAERGALIALIREKINDLIAVRQELMPDANEIVHEASVDLPEHLALL